MVDNEVNCPFCLEKIKVGAIKCKHCRTILDEEKQITEHSMDEKSFHMSNSSIKSNDSKNNNNGLISLVLGIIGFFLTLIPILSTVLSAVGLYFGRLGLKAVKRGVAVAGVTICSLSIILNLAWSTYLFWPSDNSDQGSPSGYGSTGQVTQSIETEGNEKTIDNYITPSNIPVRINHVSVEPPKFIYGSLYVTIENISNDSIDEVHLIAILFDEKGYPLSGRDRTARILQDTNLHPNDSVGQGSSWMVAGEARLAKIGVERVVFFDKPDWVDHNIQKWVEQESKRYN